jgi:membrane protein DedA with SNARE-associated domain
LVSAGGPVPRNKYIALVALVVLGVSVVELAAGLGLLGGGLLGSSASSYFSSAQVVSLMTSLGYVSLFALMTLESASLPIPSEVVLPFAGYLAFIGVMNLWVALAVSTAAALMGALIDYFLALKLGNVFVERFIRRLGMSHHSLETAEEWFRKRGAWTVFGARFVPVLRSVISLPAGLFRMPVWSFVLFTVGGCIVWNSVLIYAGFAAGSLWQTVVGNSFSSFVNLVLVAFAGLAVLYLAYYAYGRITGHN